MDLRHLKAFVTVAEELNFRRAAERLQIAQPPLSQHIKRLEHEVGVALFERSTRKVSLTPAGEACLVEARKALAAAAAVPQVAERAAAGLSGKVRMGFTGPASYEALMAVARTFRRHRPQVRLDIGPPAFSGELVAHLHNQELDAALVRLPLDTSGLRVREVAEGQICVALPASHPLADEDHVDLMQLCDAPVLDYPSHRGVAFSSTVRNAYLQLGVTPQVMQEAPDTHTLMLLVGAGNGIAFMPRSAGYLKASDVVLLPVRDLRTTVLALAWRDDDPNPALHGLVSLLDEITQVCSDIP